MATNNTNSPPAMGGSVTVPTAAAPTAAIPNTLKVDFGIADVLRGGEAEQRAYISTKQDALTNKEQNIRRQYGETFLRKNLRDAELLNTLIEQARTYLANNTSASQKKIEEEISKTMNKIDTIVSGLGIRTLAFQLIQTLTEFATGDVAAKNNIQVTPADKKTLLKAAEDITSFYNANEFGNKTIYTNTVTDSLKEIKKQNAFIGEYFTRILAASPEAYEVVQKLRALKDDPSINSDSVTFEDQIKNTIIKTAKWCLIIGLGLWAATLAANDAIFRPKGFRILNFIYGGVFFIFVLPYYIYRYFKGKSPTLFALLPLTTFKPESMIDKLIYGLFWYEQLVGYEQHLQDLWDKQATKESGSVAAGAEGVGNNNSNAGAEGVGNNNNNNNAGNNNVPTPTTLSAPAASANASGSASRLSSAPAASAKASGSASRLSSAPAASANASGSASRLSSAPAASANASGSAPAPAASANASGSAPAPAASANASGISPAPASASASASAPAPAAAANRN